MIRNFIVGAFEAFAWFFFVAVIAYATWYGWHAATLGEIHAGTMVAQPWQGALGGFVVGAITAIVGTGLIFTLLDIRAGTDRLVDLVEDELRRRRGED
jgi:hypothetical protein